MATVPTGLVLRRIRPASLSPTMRSLPEANSQDFKRGEPVYVNSGYLTKAGAADNFAGIADEAAANDAAAVTKGLRKRFLPLEAGYEFEMSVSYNETGGATDKIEATDLDTSLGIVESSLTPDAWIVNKADTTNKRITIVEFVDPVGTLYGRVMVRFIPAYYQEQRAN